MYYDFLNCDLVCGSGYVVDNLFGWLCWDDGCCMFIYDVKYMLLRLFVSM